MFLWMTLLLPPGQDSFEVVSKSAVAAGIIAVPGMAFMPSKRKTMPPARRLQLDHREDAEEAYRRIAILVDNAFSLQR